MARLVLFGSIGTLAETSELQRQAFNEAFRAHGLDWTWDRTEYAQLLADSGGRDRIAEYARRRSQAVDASAIHAEKSKRFQQMLRKSRLDPRPGVVETIRHAPRAAFISGTSRANIDALFAALEPAVTERMFDLVTDAGMVRDPKPNPDIYLLALERLGVEPAEVVVVEDNPPGAEAARRAGLKVIAFPGEMHKGASFGPVAATMHELSLTESA